MAIKAEGIKVSKTSKLGCFSWSLEALDTCPGSKTKDGRLVPACEGCYATTGNYRFGNVKAARSHNREDWKRDEFVDDFVEELDSHRYFRWFDSGDMYALELAWKIYEIMKRTPWCKHWLPTRMHKFAKFAEVLEAMQALDNVAVRFSSDSVTGEYGPEHGSTILPTAEHADASTFVCRAYENEGKCGKCRACWNKDVKMIGYVAHGKKMAKVIKIHLAK